MPELDRRFPPGSVLTAASVVLLWFSVVVGLNRHDTLGAVLCFSIVLVAIVCLVLGYRRRWAEDN